MLVRVKAKPNAKQPKIVEEADGSLTVHLKSPPAEGKANQELIELLARHFGVPKSKVRLKSGASSRQKQIAIED
jgi:uncharacterized protein